MLTPALISSMEAGAPGASYKQVGRIPCPPEYLMGKERDSQKIPLCSMQECGRCFVGYRARLNSHCALLDSWWDLSWCLMATLPHRNLSWLCPCPPWVCRKHLWNLGAVPSPLIAPLLSRAALLDVPRTFPGWAGPGCFCRFLLSETSSDVLWKI